MFESRRHAHGRCGDQRGARARFDRDAAKSRWHLRCQYRHAAGKLQQGLSLDDQRIRRARQLGRGHANGSLWPDQSTRHCGLGVPALWPGRHGYGNARNGVWLGHLVVKDDAMLRFVAGHKARLTRKDKRAWANDGPFARKAAPMNRVTSRVPDFSKLPFAPAPEQFEDVRAEPWLAPEGIGVAPVYRASDIAGLDCLDSLPGIAPYVRGPYAAMYIERPWTIRQYAGYSSAEESNAFYRRNLAAGQKGLSVAFHLPTPPACD